MESEHGDGLGVLDLEHSGQLFGHIGLGDVSLTRVHDVDDELLAGKQRILLSLTATNLDERSHLLFYFYLSLQMELLGES